MHYFEELNKTSISSRFLPLACSYENISNMRYRKLEERKYDLFFSGILQNWDHKHMQTDLRKKIQRELFHCIYDFPLLKKLKYWNLNIYWKPFYKIGLRIYFLILYMEEDYHRKIISIFFQTQNAFYIPPPL